LQQPLDNKDADKRLQDIYLTSVGELKKSFTQAQACTANGDPYEINDAFTWVYLIAEDLLPLLRLPTQESIAIFVFFCVLLKKLDSHWWMQGWPRHLVARAYDLLDEERRLWIRWPMEEIGWIPPSAIERMQTAS
jgi:hypothetical protein